MIQEKVRSMTHLLGSGRKPGGKSLSQSTSSPSETSSPRLGTVSALPRLDDPPQGDPGPDAEGAAIVAVSPDQLDAGKQLLQWREQGSASFLIGSLGPSHLDRQQMARLFNERVAFPAPHFFPHIVAFFGTANPTGFDRLAFVNSPTRLSLSPLFLLHLLPQAL